MILQKINQYLTALPSNIQGEMVQIHSLLTEWLPDGKLWFESGLDEEGKVITNPTIGYGEYTIKYADGSQRQFFQIGLSATTSGFSIHLMGIRNKLNLTTAYGETIGKAKLTSYCIKFKSINDIDISTLKNAVLSAVEVSRNKW